ncbi:MAG TPA: hypothetical protein VFT78_08295 [Hanamia sp.]|nr:hypothetical protein [Hanamia sp.]
MKNNEDKNIEKLVADMMASNPIERPSVDFTGAVMSAVLAPKAKSSLEYKPLISKRGWFIILAGFIALSVFLILNTEVIPLNKYFNLSTVHFDQFLKPFSGLNISPLTANVLIASSVMLLLQLFLLKRHIDKLFRK